MDSVVNNIQLKDTLLGRDHILDNMIDELSHVDRQISIVSGPPGIGKTQLIHSALKSCGDSIFLLDGKYNQLGADNLKSPLQRALSVFFIFVISDIELKKRWAKILQNDIGVNLKVLCDYIPELYLIVDDVNEPAQLGVSEAQVRFELMVINLLELICKFSSKKIVLFVDDLQWASESEIDLLKKILESVKTSKLHFIGSHRDNVKKNHPLHKLKEIELFNIQKIKLDGLSVKGIQDIVDLLHPNIEMKNELVASLKKSTAGNPFFILQILKTALKKQIIKDDKFNIKELEKISLSDNVVELLLDEMNDLSSEFKNLLAICSILGSDFSKEDLSAINGGHDLIISCLQWLISSILKDWTIKTLLLFHMIKSRKPLQRLLSEQN